jgi:hypothetical protein
LTVSKETSGKIFLTWLNMVLALGWSFELINSLYMALRCGVIRRLCSLHLFLKKAIKSAGLVFML